MSENTEICPLHTHFCPQDGDPKVFTFENIIKHTHRKEEKTHPKQQTKALEAIPSTFGRPPKHLQGRDQNAFQRQ